MKPRIDVVIETDARADLITALPCGCRLPFARCAQAEELLDAEWTAGNAMLRLAQTAPDDVAAYAVARARWQAAMRAYDAHIGWRADA